MLMNAVQDYVARRPRQRFPLSDRLFVDPEIENVFKIFIVLNSAITFKAKKK
jgi:hypothetical protein